jgi:Concanavalin A-like lectin/glucanases superfamily
MRNVFNIFFLIVFLSLSSFSQTTTTFPDGSLEFDSAKGHHVNHGVFWKSGVNHGVFFWEAWVKPYAGAQYVISDGYGGEHALLFGFSGGTTRLALAGNIFDLNTHIATSFGTEETVPVNQWVHIAVGWDGQQIVTFIDGVPSSITPCTGHRKTTLGGGAGVLFIGGSDHSNFNGKIARVRGFEGVLPMDSLLSSFTPEKYFRSSYIRSDGEVIAASFVADYSAPAKFYPDLSLGYGGSNHIGLLSKGPDYGYFGTMPSYTNDLPTWTPEPVTTPVYQPSTPRTIPEGAIVYDSFNRANSTLGSGGVGLGIADKSYDNQKFSRRWRGTFVNQWGILGERALNLGQTSNPVWLETGTANMDVRATKLPGGYSNGDIGIIYRYQDDSNYGWVFVGGNIVYLVEYVNGVSSFTGTGIQPPYWSYLRVVTNGNQIKVYCGVDLVISTISPNLGSATKAGLRGILAGQRSDDFTVYDASSSLKAKVALKK